jgi:hypothetical protein
MRASRLLSISFLTLAGCATSTQQEKDRLDAAATHAISEINACRAREEALPAYQALKDKLPPLDGAVPSPELQANKAKPEPEDVPLLLAFHRDGMMPCRKITLDNIAKVNPALAPPIVEAHAASDESYGRLVRREIGWGDFAMGNYQRTAALRAELLNVGAKIDEQRALREVRELQRRQAPSTGTGAGTKPASGQTIQVSPAQ